MDAAEQRALRRIYRPAADDGSCPELSEAVRAAAHDAAAQAEMEAEQAFDRAFAAKLSEVPVPAQLKGDILAALEQKLADQAEDAITFPRQPSAHPATVAPARRSNWWLHPLTLGLSAAAILTLIFGYALIFPPQPTTPRQPNLEELVAYFEQISDRVEPERQYMDDYGQLVSYLQTAGRPVPRTLPPNIQPEMGMACQAIEVDGIAVGMLCFRLPEDQEVAHIFTLNRQDLPFELDLPEPLLQQVDDHHCAIWAVGDQIYILTTQAKEEKVRELLSI